MEEHERSRAPIKTEDVSPPEKLLPESYRSNSPEEIQLLTIVDNFQRQYSDLCPDRTPLLLCPVNECEVKKFVSTTLRPTLTVHSELDSWQGCASFVADALSLVPLDPPVHLPKRLFSSTSVLQSQRATCFEYATLLCSLLLGENYDAYCVSGYAVKEMCLLDQSLQECPLLDTEIKAVTPEQKHQDNKYSVMVQLEQKSRFLAQQEKKKQEAALLEKQKLQKEETQQLADRLRGLRVHCWVLVLSGSRSIQENFFIDPLTGISYPTTSDNFLGIESVWNNLNYYVNMQDCSNGCADVMFDLDDLNTWEPLLFGAPGKKQLIEKGLKRKDMKLTSKTSNLLEEDVSKVFEMPSSWVSYITISHEAMENRFPGGEKVIRYKQAQLEKFAPRRRLHGLATRLTKYKDRDCTEVTMVKEWYQGRSDFLLEKEVNHSDNVTTERFRHGSKYHLQLFRVKRFPEGTELEMHFSSAHVEGVVQRVLSGSEMLELFEGRRDFLYYRHVTFKDLIQEFYERPEELYIMKVVERFHRNSSKPASEDVAERVFLESERLIEVTYHLTKKQSVPSKISFVTPLESEQGMAQEFTLDMISTFQMDQSEKPLTAATLQEMVLGLMEVEEEVSHQIMLSVEEVRKIVTFKEKNDVKVWSQAQAVLLPCPSPKEEIGEILPLQEHRSEEETDSRDEQKKDSDLDFKSKNEEKAKILRERCLKEEIELQRKQEWFQGKQNELSKQEKVDYQQYCAKKRIQIKAARERLHMHIQKCEKK